MRRAILGRTPSTAMMTWTFIGALAFEMIPWGHWPMPSLLALVLVFWNVFQPRRVGIALAWLLGVIMDVHSGALLGQHALAYSILSYGAIALHRRLLWYSISGQALQLFPLFLLANIVVMLISLSMSGVTPVWSYLVSPILTALCWIPFTDWIISRMNRPTNSTHAIGR